MMQTNDSLNKLLLTLHVPEHNFICISDENLEILQNIPQAETEVEVVEVRPSERDFRMFVSRFVREVLRKELPKHFCSLGLFQSLIIDLTLADIGISEVQAVKGPSSLALQSSESCTSQFQQWRIDISRGVDSSNLPDFQKTDILEAISTVCLLADAVDQVKRI